MTIDSSGCASVDGVECSTDIELKNALDDVAQAMHSNDALAATVGYVRAPDEPFLLRVDQSVRFDDLAHWLRVTRRGGFMYRTWIAVLDERSGEPRCLRIEHAPQPQYGDGPYDPDWASTLAASPTFVQLVVSASDRPWWNEQAGRAPAWRVLHWTTTGEHTSTEFDSWDGVRRVIEETPASERYFAIQGALPTNWRWSQVVPIVAEALDRWHAEIDF